MKTLSFQPLFTAIFAILLLPNMFTPAQIHGQEAAPQSTLSSTWQAPPEAVNRTNPVQSDPASIERGKAFFLEYCTTCHGKEATGDGPISSRLPVETPDLTAIAGKKKDGELAWKITTGRSPMPKWGDKLSEEQIWDLVNFIQHL